MKVKLLQLLIGKNAGSRDRTSDLQIFSLTLSQLSYTGNYWNKHINEFCLHFWI